MPSNDCATYLLARASVVEMNHINFASIGIVRVDRFFVCSRITLKAVCHSKGGLFRNVALEVSNPGLHGAWNGEFKDGCHRWAGRATRLSVRRTARGTAGMRTGDGRFQPITDPLFVRPNWVSGDDRRRRIERPNGHNITDAAQ